MEWGESAAVWHENQHSVTWPLYTHARAYAHAHTHRSIADCLGRGHIIWRNTNSDVCMRMRMRTHTNTHAHTWSLGWLRILFDSQQQREHAETNKQHIHDTSDHFRFFYSSARARETQQDALKDGSLILLGNVAYFSRRACQRRVGLAVSTSSQRQDNLPCVSCNLSVCMCACVCVCDSQLMYLTF